jgi:large subunit ribosomal protein L22
MVRAQATAKYIRTSAQKAGLVLDLIRGKDINHALSALQFSRKSVARDVAKVLRSAVANAQQKDGFGGDVERLFVSKCHADNGPSMKRVRPAPMGRAFRVVKRTTHLTVEVTERAEKIKPIVVEGTEGKSAAKKRAPSAVAGKTGGTGGKQKGKKSGKPAKTAAKRGGKTASR